MRSKRDASAEAGADLEPGRASSRPAAAPSRSGSAPTSKTSFPTTRRAAEPGPAAEPPAYSEWAGVGGGGREDGDYNLEAFVSAETTLADHLAEQLALAISDPVRRMIGQIPDRYGRRGRLPHRRSGVGGREARRAAVPRSRRCWRSCRGFDPPGVCARNLTECLAIQLKERDRFDPAMQALVDHLDLLAKRDFAALRRICGVDDEDLADMIARDPPAQSQARSGVRLRAVQPIVPDVFVRAGPTAASSSSSTPTRCPRCWSTSAIMPRSRKDREERQRQDLSRRVSADGDLAGARARSARQDHPQGGDRDRAAAGRLLRARRAAPAPAQSQDHRRRDRHARVDGLARHRQQIHGDQPRHFRTEIFLHLCDRRPPTAAKRIRPRRCVTASSR